MQMEFEEETYSRPPMGPQPSKMAAKLIKLGIVKDEKQANIVLMGLIGILVIVFFIANASGNNNSSEIKDVSIHDPVLDI